MALNSDLETRRQLGNSFLGTLTLMRNGTSQLPPLALPLTVTLALPQTLIMEAYHFHAEMGSSEVLRWQSGLASGVASRLYMVAVMTTATGYYLCYSGTS